MQWNGETSYTLCFQLCFGIYSERQFMFSVSKDIKNIRRTLGIDMILGGGMSLLFYGDCDVFALRCWDYSARCQIECYRIGNTVSHRCNFLFLYSDVLCH